MAIQLPTDVCYGSMAFFMAILHNIFLLYHVDMFVSVYKIDKFSFWVGEAIFLLWNSFNDPLFGWLSDRHYLSNSGKTVSQRDIVMKRFNALQTNGPFFAISFLAFWIPWAYPWLQFVVCLCLYDGFLTMLDLHHSALLADLSVSADIRTNLNSKCSVFSAFGSASVFLSYAFWNKDDLFTFRIFCCVLAVMSFVGFMASSNLLKNYYVAKHKEEPMPVPVQSSPEPVQSSPTKSFMSQLLSQRNFFWFAAMNLIQVFHCHFNSNFFPLFLENLLGDSISPGFGSFLLGISFVAPHINNLYFLRLCRRYGVYKVIHILFLVKLVLSVVMWLGGPSHVWLLCIYIASNRVFTEGTCKLLNLVISDLVDEDYVIHSRQQPVSALMFGTAALVSKPGQTLAPLIGTWILSMQTGHDIFQSGKDVGSIKMNYQHMDATTREAHRQGCFNLLVYIPIICAVAQSLVWMQFSLHGHRLARVKALRQGEYADHV